MEECPRDVDGDYVAAFVSINSCCDHDAAGSNGRQHAVLLLVSWLPAFFASVGNGMCTDAAVSFLDNIHQQFKCSLAFGRGK
jgi:hypothetical protein